MRKFTSKFSSPRTGASPRAMATSAAAMYGGATVIGLVEGLIPGGPAFSLVPASVALGVVIGLVTVGPRLPVAALAALGPVGAALIALAVATTHGPGDGAVLYVWPVLWQSYFFGRSGTVLIVVWIGLVHALALIALPSGVGHIDRWIDVMITMIVVGAAVDVLSERNERLLERHAAEARVDPLTHLLNRRGFEEAANAELARARRTGASVGVVSFDIDHFKRVNDEWGHEVGDRVLARLGELLAKQTRQGDLIARVGGEEFVALLAASEVPEAVDFAGRVRARFSDVDGSELPAGTLSAGVAAAVSPSDLQHLLRRADSALYAAKRGGRDRVVVDGYPIRDAVPEAGFEPATRGL